MKSRQQQAGYPLMGLVWIMFHCQSESEDRMSHFQPWLGNGSGSKTTVLKCNTVLG